jgi:hypothetical protein
MKKIVSLLITMLLALSLLSLVPPSTLADTITVPGDYTSIQEAVDNVADGDVITVAPGTYIENIVIDNPNASFTLRGGGPDVTTLDGSGDDNSAVIAVVDTGEHTVTIDGFTITNGSGDNTNWSNSCGGGIYTNFANVIVANCIITGNEAYYGGGIYNEDYDYYGDYSNTDYTYSVSVTNCTIDDNDASYGGGVYNYYTDFVSIKGCVISDNNSLEDGGGMFNEDIIAVSITSCLITGNLSEYGNGGGMHNCCSDPFVDDCTFEYNVAGYHGGGMMNGGYSAPLITNCIFRYNEAHDQGGGGMMNAGESAPRVISCTFSYNWAENRGGGMYNAGSSYAVKPYVSNCIFSYNEAGWRGGGMDNHGYSEPFVTNCVFVGNVVLGEPYSPSSATLGDTNALVSAGGGGMFNGYSCVPTVINCTFTQNSIPYYSSGGSYDGENGGGVKFTTSCTSTFTNCIIWGNYPNDVLDTDDGDVIIEYSDIGGGFPGEGNIDADPLFVNAPIDVSLRSGSPCIDAGTDMSPDVVDDILGVARPQGSAYDMGAYEYAAKGTWSPVSIMPLARTQLANALETWSELSEQLPEEPSDEMSELIERIQVHMQNATGLTNPVYASGELSKALSLMAELSALI